MVKISIIFRDDISLNREKINEIIILINNAMDDIDYGEHEQYVFEVIK